jgi:hypothetical protein
MTEHQALLTEHEALQALDQALQAACDADADRPAGPITVALSVGLWLRLQRADGMSEEAATGMLAWVTEQAATLALTPADRLDALLAEARPN